MQARLLFAAAWLGLSAGPKHVRAQGCSLSGLQTHLATVQEECCYDDSAAGLQEDLVAYWNFEEGPGNRGVEDVTGNGHDGTWRSGRSGDDMWIDSPLAGGQYGHDFRGSFDDVIEIAHKDGFPTGSSARTKAP